MAKFIQKGNLVISSSIFFYKRKLNVLSLMAIFAFFLMESCNKEDDSISYLPNGDILSVEYSDTSGIVAYSVKEDSLLVYNSILGAKSSVFLVGNYIDPVFGYSAASCYAQIGLSSTNVNFGSNLHLDSVVLSLDYAGFYGTDTASYHTIQVYELSESLHSDSTYYSNKNHSFDNVAIGTKTFIPDFATNLVLSNGDTLAPQLRVRLNDSFGQRLLDLSGQSALVDNEAFMDYFKGIYISLSSIANASGEGLIYYFDLSNIDSKLSLYYSNIDEDSISYDFTFSDDYVMHSVFSHDYTGYEIETALSDTTSGSNSLYIQSMSGIKSRILFPFIKEWSKENTVSINKAELVVSIEANTYDELSPHSQLELVTDSAAEVSQVSDITFDGDGYSFDGTYNEENHTYSFNVSLFIQDILNDKISTEYPLYLVASNAQQNANRTVLGGYQNTSSTIKLKLTYTKL